MPWLSRLLLAFCLCWLPAQAAAANGFAAFMAQPAASSLLFGVLVGTMLTAASYLFFIWLVFRHASQLLLSLMLLLLTIHMGFGNNLLLELFGLKGSSFPEFARNIALFAFLAVCIGFTSNFLDLESNNPKLRLLLIGMMISEIIGLSAASVMMRHELQEALPIIVTANMGILLIIGLVSALQRISGSGTHILAFAAFQMGSLAVPLQRGRILPISPLVAENMLYVAAALAAVVFAAVIAQQFTAQKAAKEKALQRSNDRFVLASQSANEGLYDWDVLRGQVYFSDRFKRILGQSLSADYHGLKAFWRQINHEDRRQLVHNWRQFRRSDKRGMSAEFRLQRSGGTQAIWVFMTAIAIRSKNSGKITRLVGSLGDISSKKASEYAMRLSEARFRSITEAHPVPVLIVTLANAAILYASPGTEPLTKIPQSALIGTSLKKLLGQDADKLLTALQQEQALNMQEATLAHPNGGTSPVAVTARLIQYQNTAAAVIGLYDLTERKQAEAQIAQQQEALQQSEKMAALGGLLAGVAHELNNPLSVIVGQATLLKETAQDAKVIARGEKIYTAAERCARIVKSFLAIARRKPPEHKLMQANNAVNQALELLAYPLRTENVQLRLELDPQLPLIIGDEDQFTQVVSNLILNGAQAMKDWSGKRQVTVKSFVDHATNQVCLSVVDTGPGVPDDIKARVFEPFFTTKSPGTGTGVGLSLCLNIVTAHNGELSLQDTPGGGATFLIKLPLPQQTPAATLLPSETPSAKRALHILVVDDEFELAQTLADLLTKDGHSFDFAINGKIALEKLRAQQFDFILSDLRMPEMDGPTMFKHIRAEFPYYQQRIVFITGDTLTPFVKEFLQDNPVRFIEKPYKLADVQKAMLEQIEVAEAASTQEKTA